MQIVEERNLFLAVAEAVVDLRYKSPGHRSWQTVGSDTNQRRLQMVVVKGLGAIRLPKSAAREPVAHSVRCIRE
jgi:hypothetical protein